MNYILHECNYKIFFGGGTRQRFDARGNKIAVPPLQNSFPPQLIRLSVSWLQLIRFNVILYKQYRTSHSQSRSVPWPLNSQNRIVVNLHRFFSLKQLFSSLGFLIKHCLDCSARITQCRNERQLQVQHYTRACDVFQQYIIVTQ